MAQNISVPDIGDFKDVEVIEVLVKPGDQINKNDPIVTIESDKSSLEIPSPAAGEIKSLKVQIGDKVSEGTVLATIENGKLSADKKENTKDIDWVDITDNKLATEETSKNSKELLRRLHVKDGEKVIQGAEAFLLLWKKMPKYKFLYNLFKLPVIFNLFSIGYEIVAFFLYLKNKKQLKN